MAETGDKGGKIFVVSHHRAGVKCVLMCRKKSMNHMFDVSRTRRDAACVSLRCLPLCEHVCSYSRLVLLPAVCQSKRIILQDPMFYRTAQPKQHERKHDEYGLIT